MSHSTAQNAVRLAHTKALFIALLSSLFLMVCGILVTSAGSSATDDWWDTDWHYRVQVTAGANGFKRTNKSAETELNFSPLLAGLGESGAFDPDSIRVVEVDNNDNIINDAVPFQFDPAGNFNAQNNARGTLIFQMTGVTNPSASRYYQVYFDITTANHPPANVTPLLTLDESVMHKGYDSLQINTANAEYFYHKPGGGFATLLDKQDKDWIDWSSATGAAGDFRGIPNMVHPADGGYFHPGRPKNPGDPMVSTTVLDEGPLKATFKSTSDDDKWETFCEVFPDYARMTVLKIDATEDFWWLYEGVPGVTLDPAEDFLVRSDGDTIPADGEWTTDIPNPEWLFVKDTTLGRSLYLVHHEDDTKVDGYFVLGDSPDQMTVFGFGRSGNSRSLDSLPNHFTFGFIDSTDFNAVEMAVNGAYKPLNISVATVAETPDTTPTAEPTTTTPVPSPSATPSATPSTTPSATPSSTPVPGYENYLPFVTCPTTDSNCALP